MVTMPPSDDEARQILAGLADGQAGSADALNRIFPLVFDQLQRLAAHALQREHAGWEMQPGDLVDETYVRLFGDAHLHWNSRAHFCAIAAIAMRQILIEAARRRTAAKRGGGWTRIVFDEGIASGGRSMLDILELDAALTRLRDSHPRRERVAELRVFSGMTAGEIAGVLGVSERTVQEDWRAARRWLARELSGGTGKPAAPHVEPKPGRPRRGGGPPS